MPNMVNERNYVYYSVRVKLSDIQNPAIFTFFVLLRTAYQQTI